MEWVGRARRTHFVPNDSYGLETILLPLLPMLATRAPGCKGVAVRTFLHCLGIGWQHCTASGEPHTVGSGCPRPPNGPGLGLQAQGDAVARPHEAVPVPGVPPPGHRQRGDVGPQGPPPVAPRPLHALRRLRRPARPARSIASIAHVCRPVNKRSVRHRCSAWLVRSNRHPSMLAAVALATAAVSPSWDRGRRLPCA